MLYEIIFNQFENGVFKRQNSHQIPADSELNAAVVLGQIYHREETTIEIISITKVK